VQKELDEGVLTQLPLEVPIPHRIIGFATTSLMPQNSAVRQFLDFIRERTPLR
jgi:hypothetical protein